MAESMLNEEIIDAGDTEENAGRSEETSSFTDSIDSKVKKSKTFEWFYERQFDKFNLNIHIKVAFIMKRIAIHFL